MSISSYTAGETAATIATNAQQTELQQVEVRVNAKHIKATHPYSIASDGSLRNRASLGVLDKVNTFTVSVTIVNYDEQALNSTGARALVDAVVEKNVSIWQFGGKSNILTGLYFHGYQLDIRQLSVNGLAGMYGTQGTVSIQVGFTQLVKGAPTAVNGMDPGGAVSGSVNIGTKRAADGSSREIGLGWFSNNRVQDTFDSGRRFSENKEFGVHVSGKLRRGDTLRHNYGEDNKEFTSNADYRGETLYVVFSSTYVKRETNGDHACMQGI